MEADTSFRAAGNLLFRACRPCGLHVVFQLRKQWILKQRTRRDESRKQRVAVVTLQWAAIQSAHETSRTEDECNTGCDIPFVFWRQREGDVIQPGRDAGQLVRN